MKKLVLTAFNKIELIEAPVPIPGPGQAVVRIQYAGICGSDLHVFSGLHPTAQPPLVLGHEACGKVYALHSDREDIQVGDEVCFHTIRPCRSCENCCNGHENLCAHVKIMGTNFDGVFTQYLLVEADRLIKFNANADVRIAALVEPLTVGIHDVRRSGLNPGGNVFIAGAGPIGLIIAIIARFSGAAHVVLSELNPIRIELARSMGFTVADPTKTDFQQICDSATNLAGFDAAFEITSSQAGFNTCVSQLKRGGVMVQVGMPPRDQIFGLEIDKIIYGETELRGVRHHTMADMHRAVQLINSGVVNESLEQLISAVYPMEKSVEAFARAESDKSALRILIDLS